MCADDSIRRWALLASANGNRLSITGASSRNRRAATRW